MWVYVTESQWRTEGEWIDSVYHGDRAWDFHAAHEEDFQIHSPGSRLVDPVKAIAWFLARMREVDVERLETKQLRLPDDSRKRIYRLVWPDEELIEKRLQDLTVRAAKSLDLAVVGE